MEKNRSSTTVMALPVRNDRMFSTPHPRHGITHLARAEIAQRQVQQMPEQARAQLHVDAAGGVREHIAAQRGQHDLERHHRQQPDRDHVQRGEAAVHQHLVHHHLEEQRRHQREALDDEGHQEYLEQQLAVAHHRRDEPAEIELGQRAGDRGARGHQDQLAGPGPLQLVQRQLVGAAATRILDQRLAGIDARQDEEIAFAVTTDGRQGRRRQPIHTHLGATGAQVQLARGQQDLGHAEWRAIGAEFVSQLVRVGGDLVVAGQHGEAEQAGVGRGGLGLRCASVRRRTARSAGCTFDMLHAFACRAPSFIASWPPAPGSAPPRSSAAAW